MENSRNQGEDQRRNDQERTSRNDQRNDQQLEQKWKNIETSYRDRYPDLTEDDTSYREGEFDNMTQRVAERTNRSREEVQNEIRDWKA